MARVGVGAPMPDAPVGASPGRSVSTHMVVDSGSNITVLSRGEIIAEGDYRSVSAHPEVIKAYLGSEHA
jgi:hypothetical protein